jgi:hypothetical protein
MATKKKQAKTRRTSTARRAAKPRAKKAKAAKKKKATAKKKPAAKKKLAKKKLVAKKRPAVRKKLAKAKKRPAARRKPAAKAPARTAPVAAKTQPATRAAAAPPPAPVTRAPEHDPREEIEMALSRRGIDSTMPALVDVLSAVARGYESGPASPPPGVVIDVDTPIADALVDRYQQGDRELDRRMHRPQVLATVGFNLDQLGLAETNEDARNVLTTLCLGSWDPSTGSHAQLDGTASFVVRFYRDGL